MHRTFLSGSKEAEPTRVCIFEDAILLTAIRVLRVNMYSFTSLSLFLSIYFSLIAI